MRMYCATLVHQNSVKFINVLEKVLFAQIKKQQLEIYSFQFKGCTV